MSVGIGHENDRDVGLVWRGGIRSRWLGLCGGWTVDRGLQYPLGAIEGEEGILEKDRKGDGEDTVVLFNGRSPRPPILLNVGASKIVGRTRGDRPQAPPGSRTWFGEGGSRSRQLRVRGDEQWIGCVAVAVGSRRQRGEIKI